MPRTRENTEMLPFLLGASLGISFLLAYYPVLKDLAVVWYSTEEYSHGFLVLPISFAMLWRKRDVLTAAEREPSAWGVVLLFLSISIYIFASYAEIMTICSLTMIPLLAGIVLYLHGFHLLRIMGFPLLFLIFMIPVPAQIFVQLTIPLQLFVSKASSFVALSLGIPLLREGNLIHLPQQTLQVVQACSGLMSLISLSMLSTVIGYFALSSNAMRTVLLLLSIPTAVLVNIIRVFMLITFFYYFGIDLTGESLHIFYGVVIFGLSVAILLFMTGILAKWNTTPLQGSLSS